MPGSEDRDNPSPSAGGLWEWVVIPAMVFSLAAIILTYPVILHLGDSAPDTADPLLNSWILAWDAHALATDPVNLYNANSFYPYDNTLAYSETLLGQAILAAPIIWATDNPVLALNICWLLTFALSGIAMYVLVFELTHTKTAALVAGMIFAFTSFRFAHVAHLQILSAQWIPLAMFFLLRLLRTRQWRYVLGLWLSFNLQVLSCYYFGLFAAVGLGLLFFIAMLLWRPPITRRLLLQMSGFVLCTAALQIPLSLPYFKVAASLDFERSLADVAREGADLTDFITTAPGNLLFGSLTAPLRGKGWWEHVTFPGIVALILALLAFGRVTLDRYRKAALGWGLLTLAGFVLSLGPALNVNDQVVLSPLPYRLLYEFVPGFRAIRQPARFHVITMTGLSVLAGIGMTGLIGRLRRNSLRASVAALALAGLGLESWTAPLSLFATPDQIPPAYTWLADQPGEGPVLELPILMDIGNTESLRLFYATTHWKRMINGYGGFYPPTYAYFLFFDREFPAQPYDWIVGLGTRYVLLHRWQYGAEELEAIDRGLQGFQGRLNLVANFGEDQIYEVIHPNTHLPNQPGLERTVGDGMRLLGYIIKPPGESRPDSLEVKLFWQCLRSMDRDYTVFVHVVDESGGLVTQHDGQPANGTKPTSGCKVEEVVVDSHTVQIPRDLSAGTYGVHVGMYDLQTMVRLPVRDHSDMMAADTLDLGTVHLGTAQ